MKKLITIIVVLAMMAGICSCGNNNSDGGSKADEKTSSDKTLSDAESTDDESSAVTDESSQADGASETDSSSSESSLDSEVSDVSSAADTSSEVPRGSSSHDEIKAKLTAACENAEVKLIGKSTVPRDEGMRIFDDQSNLDVYSFRIDFDNAAEVFAILDKNTDIFINLGFADDKGEYEGFDAYDWHMYWYSDLEWMVYTEEEKKRDDDNKCVYGILQMPEGKSLDDLKLFLKFGSLWGDDEEAFMYDVENTDVVDFDFSQDDSLDCIDGEYFLHYEQTDEASSLYKSQGRYCDECKGKDIICSERFYDYVCLSKPGKYVYTEDISYYGSDGENTDNKLHIHSQSVSAQWEKQNFSTGWRIFYIVDVDKAKWDADEELDKGSRTYQKEMYMYLSKCIENAWFSLDGTERFNAHTGVPLHLEAKLRF